MLSVAQAVRIERAHFNDGAIGICDQSWVGEIHERHVVHALVAAGLLERVGLSATDPSTTMFALTDAGRRAYATDGRIDRRHRCTNPVCCRVWPEDDPATMPWGSCQHCHAWKTAPGGIMGRHNVAVRTRCPGVGQLTIQALNRKDPS